MSRSDRLNSLAQDILASYDTRRAAVATIVRDTHGLLARFHQEHEQMARDLKRTLASSENVRRQECALLMRKIKDEIAAIKKETHEMLADFADENRQAHATWVNLSRVMSAKRAESLNTGKK